MIVCVCNAVKDKDLLQAIKEAPLIKYDPFSNDYVTDTEQVYQYAKEQLDIGTKCGTCEIFIKQIISDALYRRSNRGV